MIFKDRTNAGKLLAKELKKLKLDPKSTVTIAVPRGGVIVASEVARILKTPLLPVVVKKLGAPNNPELAIGATASFGPPVFDHWLIKELHISGDYLKGEIRNKKKEARNREKFLNTQLSEKDLKGKFVVVVDDGLATGQTARAAAKILKSLSPKELILAVPCAPPSAIDIVKGDYDKIVSLQISPDFQAVGQFYRDFRPIEDEEVKFILNKH